MENYMVISLTMNKEKEFFFEMQNELAESVFERRCDVISKYYKEKHSAIVFFRRSVNEIISTPEFAEVEYNFELSDSEKSTLANMLKVFFANGKTDREEVDEDMHLVGVIYKRTNAEVIVSHKALIVDPAMRYLGL